MSEEQFKGFWDAVSSDPKVLAKLQENPDADSVVELAKSLGFTIRPDQVKPVSLSDDELDGVSGGAASTDTPAGSASACGCGCSCAACG